MWEKGKSGNNSGRPLGRKNDMTMQVREAFTLLLQKKLPDMEAMIDKVAEKNPDKALELIIKITERFVPRLTKNEITGADGQDLFKNITFNFNKINKNDDEDV